MRPIDASASAKITAAVADSRVRPDAVYCPRRTSSLIGASNWSIWRRATAFPRLRRTALLRPSWRADDLRAGFCGPVGVRVGVMSTAYSRVRYPANLPVHVPTKYEPVINLKTASTRDDSVCDVARRRRRDDRMSAPGKAGAVQPVEDRPG